MARMLADASLATASEATYVTVNVRVVVILLAMCAVASESCLWGVVAATRIGPFSASAFRDYLFDAGAFNGASRGNAIASVLVSVTVLVNVVFFLANAVFAAAASPHKTHREFLLADNGDELLRCGTFWEKLLASPSLSVSARAVFFWSSKVSKLAAKVHAHADPASVVWYLLLAVLIRALYFAGVAERVASGRYPRNMGEPRSLREWAALALPASPEKQRLLDLCAICLLPLSMASGAGGIAVAETLVLLGCTHSYHHACLGSWERTITGLPRGIVRGPPPPLEPRRSSANCCLSKQARLLQRPPEALGPWMVSFSTKATCRVASCPLCRQQRNGLVLDAGAYPAPSPPQAAKPTLRVTRRTSTTQSGGLRGHG